MKRCLDCRCIVDENSPFDLCLGCRVAAAEAAATIDEMRIAALDPPTRDYDLLQDVFPTSPIE